MLMGSLHAGRLLSQAKATASHLLAVTLSDIQSNHEIRHMLLFVVFKYVPGFKTGLFHQSPPSSLP